MVTATPGSGQRPVIVLTEPIAEPGLQILREAGEVHIAHATDAAGLAEALADATALVVRSSLVGEEILQHAPGLKVLGRHGAGLDNVDLQAAARRGIAVVNTPAANADSVAEFVILAALALSRTLLPAHRAFVDGRLHGRGSLPGAVVQADLGGAMLTGRTIGLIGLGAIGAKVTGYAQAFGTEVLATDPAITQPPPGVTMVGLDELLERSDVISMHVPLVPATRGLIDADALARMRPGALLINTARAGVVDSAAVLNALDDGRLGGYAVDVYDPEPPDPDDPLLRHPRVLATPHMAAMTVDSLGEMARSVASGVAAVLAGANPANLVPPPADPSQEN